MSSYDNSRKTLGIISIVVIITLIITNSILFKMYIDVSKSSLNSVQLVSNVSLNDSLMVVEFMRSNNCPTLFYRSPTDYESLPEALHCSREVCTEDGFCKFEREEYLVFE